MRFCLLFLLFSFLPVWANSEIESILKQDFPQAKFRVDGVMQAQNKEWLLLKPEIEQPVENLELSLKTEDQVYLFSNGWIYTPIEKNSVKSFDYYPQAVQEQILKNQITQEWIVPKAFKLPRDLAMLAGRIPLELTQVELASERELIYRQRIKEEQSEKTFAFLAYSAQNGSLHHVYVPEKDELKIQNLTEQSKNLAYLSKLKTINKQKYLIDYTQAKVYLLKNKTKENFDARKAGQNPDKYTIEYKVEIEEAFDLARYDINTGLKDFEISSDGTVAYFLSAVDPKLLIVDTQTKQLIKQIVIPKASDGLQIISRNTTEPDHLIMFSRSENELYMVNTFDHRIFREIDLKTIKPETHYIPHASLISNKSLLLAVETIKHNAPQRRKGQILELDVITGALKSIIDLDFLPSAMKFSQSGDDIFVLGANFKGESLVSKLKSLNLELAKTINLAPDFIAPSHLENSSSGKFLLIPSSATPLVGLVDIKEFELVKKLDIGSPSNLLLSL